MINLNELSCRLHINCRGCNVWLTKAFSSLRTVTRTDFISHFHEDVKFVSADDGEIII